MIERFFFGDYGSAPSDWQPMLLGLLIACVAGQLIAWVYMLTHSGLSYSKSFVNSLIVIPAIVALVMMVLSNNLVTAFGMMAVFAIVRFRNILRDTLDTAYILTTIVIGMAAGTQKYASAVIGCGVICVVLAYLWYTSFGSRQRYDLIVNLRWVRSMADLEELRRVLDRHSSKTRLASQRSHDGDEGTDLSYRLLLRDSNRAEELLTEMRQLSGVTEVTSVLAEDESEL